MIAYIEEIARFEGKTVTLRGWLHNRRSSGKIHFLTVRDGSGFIQCVMSKQAVGEEIFTRADHLSQESAVIVHGTVRADSRAPGGFEIDVTGLDVVSEAQNYPITPKEHGVDFLMDRRHLWIRAPRQQAILRIRHEVIDAVRDYFNSRHFVLADTPIFTPAACEGTTTLFPVQYFDDTTAFLTQSGQLYNEANAMALGRVYCFGPTFRAEKSKTRRHLTEFWMVEPEMAYADLDDVMELAEARLTDAVLGVREEYLDIARRTVDSEFGSLAGYLESAGVTDDDIYVRLFNADGSAKGAAFAIGIFAARFLKSSDRETAVQRRLRRETARLSLDNLPRMRYTRIVCAAPSGRVATI